MKKALTFTALMMLLMAGSVFGLGVNKVSGDGTCPAGYGLLTFEEAQNANKTACAALGQWDIARLRDGGSMDGSGYGCKVREHDSRKLGDTLCVQLVFSESSSNKCSGSIMVDYATATANKSAACQVLGGWDIARLWGGGSMDGPDYGCSTRSEDSRTLGNALCRQELTD